MSATQRTGSWRPRWAAGRLRGERLMLLAIVTGCFVGLYLGAFAGQAPVVVTVFPAPGDLVASPTTQLAFRGAPVGALGRIHVTGSRSGRHTGRFRADSDGRGGSFLPAKPFAAGEVVTVRTGLRVRGARQGSFRFTVANPAGAIPLAGLGPSSRVAGDVDTFRSRPDLAPAAVEITKPASDPGHGEVFITPQQGPLQNGPMIVSPKGGLLWFEPLPKGEMAADLRVQRYRGGRVLTWWQGFSGAGLGLGEDVIEDSSYRQLAVVRAANGLQADLHEFELTPQGTAVITAYYPVYWSLAGVGGPTHGIVLDSVVQEIDIRTGLLLFQWDSLDHIPLTDSYEPLPHSAGQPYDYFHVNSVQRQRDGSLVISARNTWAAYKVSRRTGDVVWALGGKHSSFRLKPGASFAFQHDVRVHSRTAGVTVFDNGAGPPAVHQQSRGLTLRLDAKRKLATVVGAVGRTPPLLASFEGDVQSLHDGYQFLGWGQQPYFTEFDARGRVVFDGRFVGDNSSYRAYRFRWSAVPHAPPALAASTSAATTTIYASWNGATTVAAWRVLAGAARGSLRPVQAGRVTGFETKLTIPAAAHVAVQAVDSRGRVIATSSTIAPS